MKKKKKRCEALIGLFLWLQDYNSSISFALALLFSAKPCPALTGLNLQRPSSLLTLLLRLPSSRSERVKRQTNPITRTPTAGWAASTSWQPLERRPALLLLAATDCTPMRPYRRYDWPARPHHATQSKLNRRHCFFALAASPDHGRRWSLCEV
ncbi:hypothetical protein IWZ01DRAFT_136686 [Phyllosticta capitalensis]